MRLKPFPPCGSNNGSIYVYATSAPSRREGGGCIAPVKYHLVKMVTPCSNATALLVSWNTGSSVLFFLDPVAVEIVEWHLDLGVIHDLKIVSETTLVVLHGDVPKVSLVQSCSADQFLQIYGFDMKVAVELAVELKLNDAIVVNSLYTQWLAHLEKISAKSGEYDELTAVYLHDLRRVAHSSLSTTS